MPVTTASKAPQGNDHLYGGDGDDWITDYENDDFIHGGAGNDYINAGPGVLDTSHGGDGDDEVHGGDGVDEVFGDDGNDRLYGDGDTDLILGGDGSDFMDGGDSVDEMFGGNGNDWMRGGVGDDNINGGSGNDLMEGGLGPTANDGDRLNGDTAPGALPVIEYNGDGTEGDMDIASYENVSFSIVASLQDANANGTSSNLLDTYALVEGLVGSAQDDTLTGADADGTAGNGVNNYLIGGGGNDILAGLGDDAGINPDTLAAEASRIDFIFGDEVVVDNDLYWIGDARHSATNIIDTTVGVSGYIENWYGTGETRVAFIDTASGVKSLGHILGDHGAAGDADVAIYRGNRSDYTVEHINLNGQDVVRITDLRSATDANGNPVATDGVDVLVDVEIARFADGDFLLVSSPPTDIVWNADTSGSTGLLSHMATLSALPDGGDYSYEIRPDSASGFTLFPGGSGELYRSGGNIGDNSDLTLNLRATNATGDNYDETVHIRTGSNGANTLIGGSGTDVVYARSGNDVVNGNDGDDAIFGQGGNDTIDGGAGDDTIFWNATGLGGAVFGNPFFIGSTDGRDVVNGGSGKDTFTLSSTVLGSGSNVDETFDIWTRAAAGSTFGALAAATEIIVTRNGTIVAELAGIEEIVINTGPGNDTVTTHGDFTGTSLLQSTITINGEDGDDTVDISDQTSNHRVVFRGGAGTNVLIGEHRPQDVLENAAMAGAPGTSGGNGDPSAGGSGSGSGDGSSLGDDLDDGDETDGEGSTGDGSDDMSDDDASTGTSPTEVPQILPLAAGTTHLGTPDPDVMIGDGGDDVLSGGAGDDLIKGGDGSDVIMGGDGKDDLFGGAGHDMIFGDAGNDRIFAGDGDDVVEGGSGWDTVYLGAGDDRVIATVYDGKDVYWGDAGQDTLDYSAITANLTVDLGNGLLQHGSVSSDHTNTDTIFGFENVIGGTGNDTIFASSVANVMDGGLGDDTFVFRSAGDADGDRIAGFQPGDKIDLSGIDANAGTAGNQSFVLYAGSVFTAVGQVMVTSQTGPDGEHTIVKGHMSADGSSDFTIDLKGHHDLTASDFTGVVN